MMELLDEEWKIVAVTALPVGWRNVFLDDDNTLFATACPALLSIERRTSPYDVIVLFGDTNFGSAEVSEINTQLSNYVCTIGPDEPLPDLDEAIKRVEIRQSD